MSYYYPQNINLIGTGATDTDEFVLCFHERVEVIGAKVVAIGADVTQHSANGAFIKVLGNDKATVIFQYRTITGQQGTLTQDAPADLISQNATDKAIFEAGSAIKVQLTKESSGVAADLGVSIQIRQARAY